MDIPILYHTFDAAGTSMHFSKIGFLITTITIGFIFILIGLLPYFVSYIKNKPEMGFIKWFNKVGEDFTLKKLFLIILMWLSLITPFFSANISKFFTSGEEGGLFLEPNISDKRTIPSFPIMSPEFYKKFGYYDENTLTNKYSQEFQQAIKNNKEMKQYHIPECESDNSESIICGGYAMEAVQANKGKEIVSLIPHFSLDEKDAQIPLTNPQDKGIPVYFWIEEEKQY